MKKHQTERFNPLTPADRAGKPLIGGDSPGLAKMMTRMAARESFESGSKDLLCYSGVLRICFPSGCKDA